VDDASFGVRHFGERIDKAGDRWLAGRHAACSWYEGAYLHFALYQAKSNQTTTLTQTVIGAWGGFGVLCGPLLQAGLRFHAEAASAGNEHGLRALLRPLVMRSAWMTTGVLAAGSVVFELPSGRTVSPWALAAGLLVIVPLL
jgi:hypothetical protein